MINNKAYTGYNDCGCNSGNYNLPLINVNCGTCEEELGCIITDTKCVIYNGDTLTILGVEAGTDLEVILQAINDLIGSGGNPDYSTYNTACLIDSGSTSTQKDFVETISSFVCSTNTTLNTFLNTTYPTYVSNTSATITTIRLPGTTGCTTMPIAGGSTINQVLQILSNKLCSIDTAINVASVDWSNCFTVVTSPTNVYEGFTEVLRQICLVNSNIPDGIDTYKVKLTSTDITEDYLANKIKSSSCVTINQITDTDSIKKLQLGLSFTPTTYTFNPVHFDITTGTNDGCVQSYNVSLDSSVIGSTITCDTISDIFPDSVSLMYTFIGKDSTGDCISLDECHMRYSLFKSFGDGIYSIQIDNTQSDFCNKFKLVPNTGGGSVSSVGLSQVGTSIFSITNTPITTSGTIGLGLAQQSANTFLLGPTSGSPSIPTFRTLSTVDLPNNVVTYPKIQQSTAKKLLGNFATSTGNIGEITIGTNLVLTDGGVLNAAGSGTFTPNACSTFPYSALDTTIPSSGTNGTGNLSYTFVDFTTQISTLVSSTPSINPPAYRFDAAGNLGLLGNITFQLSSIPTIVTEDILIPFADIHTFYDDECATLQRNFHKFIGNYTIRTGGSTFGQIEVFLCLDVLAQTFNLLLLARSTSKFTDAPITISLDSIVIPMQDIV